MSTAEIPLLVVLDVDSTLSNEEGIDELARAAGPSYAAKVAEITEEAMCGDVDFATSLATRLDVLAGAPEEIVAIAKSRITATDGAKELIEAVHATGGRVCAVSGGFHELIDSLMESLGVDQWRAHRLVIDNGVLTGQRDGELIDSHAKAQWLQRWRDEYGASRCVAIGDGANDLEMMAAADYSIGFDPKPAVRARATQCIDTRNLAEAIDLVGLVRG